jgi:hypothetical protein
MKDRVKGKRLKLRKRDPKVTTPDIALDPLQQLGYLTVK